MKKTLLVLALLTLLPVAAQAGPIVGQTIVLNYGSYGNYNVWHGAPDAYTFDTFCVENAEYFSPGGSYDIRGISKSVDTNNGQLPVPTVNAMVGYLYAGFVNHTLSGYTASQKSALQNAIWMALGEMTPNTGNAFYNDAVLHSSGFDYSNVWILNLYTKSGARAQDQLYMVPEPGSMLLLGTGLIGLGMVVRRKARR